MKTILTTLTASLLLTGTTQAGTIISDLDLAATGSYTDASATVVTTSQSFAGATFDILYTLGAQSNGANPFIDSNGSQYGVGSDTDIAAHYLTLEGSDGEGISFTSLSIDNFVANASGLTIADITDLRFNSFSVNNANNAQDGVNIGYTSFTNTDNVNLNTGGAAQTISLTAQTNYPGSPTGLFLANDNGFGSNRWAVTGIGVSYAVPEPGSYALLAGLLGLSYVMVRRRK